MDVDIANCVKSFAVFEYLDYDCLEMLLLQTIRTATQMKLFSLAVIVDSFALLDIRNPQLVSISKQIILQQLQIYKGEIPEQLVSPFKLEILDALIFQSAFCNQMFHEEEILYGLEELLIANIGELDGIQVADLFNNHARWASHMVDVCLIKKEQPHAKFRQFWVYNDIFYEKCASVLESRLVDMDLHAQMTVMLNGNIIHMRRYRQTKIMFHFVVKGVTNIKKEQEFLGDRLDITCWHYYRIGRRYCKGPKQLAMLEQAFTDIGVDIERIREQNLKEKLTLPRERGIHWNVPQKDLESKMEWFEKAAQVYETLD